MPTATLPARKPIATLWNSVLDEWLDTMLRSHDDASRPDPHALRDLGLRHDEISSLRGEAARRPLIERW